MAKPTLLDSRIRAGVWHGLVRADAAPQVEVLHQGGALAGVQVTAAGRDWAVTVPIPPAALNEGVQAFLVRGTDGEAIGSFAISAGAALDGDPVAEIALLRAELDLLKAAFRRHCREGGDDAA